MATANPYRPADDWIVTIGHAVTEVHDADGELVLALSREIAPTRATALAFCSEKAKAFDWGVQHGQHMKTAEIRESLGLQNQEPLCITGVA